jgi:autoinducer 2-degrading protein
MFAVVVTLSLKPETMAKFMPLMLSNATASLTEDGCKQFDVCTDPARPNEVFLYETYTTAEAFQFHLKTPHFLAFDAAATDMILGKDVRTYQSVQQ